MIEIRNLKKRFGKLSVLAGLDLTIQEGETLVILGPSGIGKSVLLKHIIGLIKPDEGYIDIQGTRITDLSGSHLFQAIGEMGMLFQGAALFDSMNVEENVGFYFHQHPRWREEKGYHKGEISDLVAHALEMVGLEGTQKKMPSELSGGMRKRAGLARLIVYRPKIILYDEPTTGLDPIIAGQINSLIVKTKEELKATSIVVTHDLFSALYIGDRLALIRDGKIAHIDKPDPFLQIEDPLIQQLLCSISQDPRELYKRGRHSHG